MNKEIFKSVFLYICDNEGRIKIVINSISENQTVEKNEMIFDRVLPDSEVVWHSLINDSENEPQDKHWKGFLMSFNGEAYACLLSVLGKNQVMVLGMENDIQQSLYEEIMKINGQLTNTIRSLYKEKSATQLDAYDEISKMNNVLANARRELKKKNYELEELNLQLEQLSIKDVMTDLYNRRYFYSYTRDVAYRAKRLNYSCTLIMIDINGFKNVNDNFGHDIGDMLLVHLSNCLKSAFRVGQDTAFRIGGDEFLILLEASTYNEALLAMKRLNNLYEMDSKGTTLAAGIIEIHHDKIQDDFTVFLKIADELMYKEKNRMKNL